MTYPPRGAPASHQLQRLRSIDGARTVAVVAVVAFHANITLAIGGWLGVNFFIVLSGWLITSGLIATLRSDDAIDYVNFLARRLRRLAPGAAVVIAVVALLHLLRQLPLRVSSVIAGATWTSNWHQLMSSSGYWERLAGPQPLDHLWSLAVEEQFYLVWPLAVVGICALTRRAVIARRIVLIRAVALGGALASMLIAAIGAHRGWTLDRLYLGTDTRAAGFLLGSSCAGWNPRRATRTGRALASCGPAAAAALVIAACRLEATQAMFGGLIQALDVACLITVMWVVTLRRGVVTWRPTVWLGRISYGVYLWHWPLMMLLHPVTNDWLRAGLTLGASSLMAAASNRWVETPIRYSGRGAHVRRQPLALRLGLVLGAFAVVIAVALSNGHRGTTRPFDLSFSPAEIKEIAVPSPSPSPSPTLTRPPTPEGRPICRSIIHIGDSNLGVARPLFKAAYAGTGVEAFIDHANGRSAYRAHSSLDDGTISAIRRLGATAISPRCWIIAATLEDAAESRQAGESPTTRIHDVVEALHGEPSIWLTPALRGPEPYSQTAAQAYSAALMQQLSDEPNVSILDWRSLATPRAAEFQPDGIHYTHPLYTSLVRAVMAEVTDNWTLIVDRS